MNKYGIAIKNKVAAILLGVVATCSFTACENDENENQPSQNEGRTVIVYMAADNSLSKFVKDDLKEIANGIKNGDLGSNDRIVIYVDEGSAPMVYLADNKLKNQEEPEFDLIYSYSGNINSCDPDVLANLIDYVKKNYRADSYGLLMWSHGTGWIKSLYEEDNVANQRKAFGIDEKGSSSASSKYHQMNIDLMAKAIKNAGGVDFIFFDACFMQSIEVDYQLRNATKYIIASPCEIPDLGADYSLVVPAMFSKDNYAQKIVDAYYKAYSDKGNKYGINISAVRTDALESFASYMRGVISANRDKLTGGSYTYNLDYYIFANWGVQEPDFYDMQSVMLQILTDDELNNWKKHVSEILISKKTTYYWFSAEGNSRKFFFDDEEWCGVSMFVPNDDYKLYNKDFNSDFETTDWGKAVWSL